MPAQTAIQAPIAPPSSLADTPVPRLSPGTRVDGVRSGNPEGTVPPEPIANGRGYSNRFVESVKSAVGSAAGDVVTSVIGDWTALDVGTTTGTTAAAARDDVQVQNPKLYKDSAYASGRAQRFSNGSLQYGFAFGALQFECETESVARSLLVEEVFAALTGEMVVLKEYGFNSSNCFYSNKVLTVNPERAIYTNGRRFIRVSRKLAAGAAATADNMDIKSDFFYHGQHLATYAMMEVPAANMKQSC